MNVFGQLMLPDFTVAELIECVLQRTLGKCDADFMHGPGAPGGGNYQHDL